MNRYAIKLSQTIVLIVSHHYNSPPLVDLYGFMKTVSISSDSATREWVLVDATGQVLGRLAAQVAARLRGKHKPEYTPHSDCGDYVIIINASKVRVTGNKTRDKKYFSHTGFPGGIKEINFSQMMERFPQRAIEKAVKGMLPKNKLSNQIIKKLKIYSGSDHPHSSQKPKELAI